MAEHNITPHLVLNLTDNILRAAEAHMLRELEVNAAFRLTDALKVVNLQVRPFLVCHIDDRVHEFWRGRKRAVADEIPLATGLLHFGAQRCRLLRGDMVRRQLHIEPRVKVRLEEAVNRLLLAGATVGHEQTLLGRQLDVDFRRQLIRPLQLLERHTDLNRVVNQSDRRGGIDLRKVDSRAGLTRLGV